MHKYQPRIHVVRLKGGNCSLENIPTSQFKTFIFPETIFTAVTAYQNQLVSQSIHLIEMYFQLSTVKYHYFISKI